MTGPETIEDAEFASSLGSRASGPIPPNSILVFRISLLSMA